MKSRTKWRQLNRKFELKVQPHLMLLAGEFVKGTLHQKTITCACGATHLTDEWITKLFHGTEVVVHREKDSFLQLERMFCDHCQRSLYEDSNREE